MKKAWGKLFSPIPPRLLFFSITLLVAREFLSSLCLSWLFDERSAEEQLIPCSQPFFISSLVAREWEKIEKQKKRKDRMCIFFLSWVFSPSLSFYRLRVFFPPQANISNLCLGTHCDGGAEKIRETRRVIFSAEKIPCLLFFHIFDVKASTRRKVRSTTQKTFNYYSSCR